MTFADKRLRVIARKASHRCETKTVGHGKSDKGKDFWIVIPWSRYGLESAIFDALKEARAKRLV